MIPIGIDLERRRTPWVNYALIGANVLLFLVTLTNERLKNQLALPARDPGRFSTALFAEDLARLMVGDKTLPENAAETMRQAIGPEGLQTLATMQNIAYARLGYSRFRPVPTQVQYAVAEAVAGEYVRLNVDMAARDHYVQQVHGYQTGGLWAAPWTLITHGFMHAGWLHIIGNMIFLWLFGNALNNRLGHSGYAAVYLVCLLAAAFSHYFLSDAPAIGASGAIAGVSGACVMYYPFVRVRALVPIFYIYRVMRLPLVIYIGFEFAYNVWQQFSGDQSGIAYWAHIGGYVSGFLIALVLIAARITPHREGPLDLLTWLRHRRHPHAAFPAAAQEVRPEDAKKDEQDDEDDGWF